MKSLTLLAGGLAAFGVADSAEAMVADGGYKPPEPTPSKSKTSTPAKAPTAKKSPASQPASPPTRTDASDGYAGMEESRAQLPQTSSSGSGSSSDSGSSGFSGSGSSGSGSSGSGSSGSRSTAGAVGSGSSGSGSVGSGSSGSGSSGSSGSSVGKSVSKAARSASKGAKSAAPTPSSAPSPKRKTRAATPARAASPGPTASPEPDPGPKRPNRPPPGTKLGPGGELYPAPQPPPQTDAQPPAASSDASSDETDQVTPSERRAARKAGRAVRRAANTVENAVDNLFGGESTPAAGGSTSSQGESTPPRPRAHSAKAADEDPYPGGPNSAGPLDNPFLQDLFGLAPFGGFEPGESASIQGGCSGSTADPAKCFGKEIGDEADKSKKKGKQSKPGATRKPGTTGRTPAGRKPRIGPYLGMDVVASTSAKRGEPEVRRNGKEYSDLSVSARVEDKATAGFDFRLFGTEVSLTEAGTLDYDVTVKSDRADRIADGERPPDPYRPRSFGKGESAVMKRSESEGGGGTTSVGPLRFGASGEEGTSEVSGVQGLGRDRVRVSVGSEDFVRGKADLGLGIPELNGSVNGGDEYREGEESSIVLDLSTAAGRREYRKFLESGVMPAPEGPGRDDASTASGYTWSEDGGFSVTAGPVTANNGGSEHSQSEVTEKTVDEKDESEKVTFSHEWGDTNLEQVSRTRPDGTQAPDRSEITVDDAPSDAVEEALSMRGVSDMPEIEDEATVRVDFDDDDLQAIQDAVIDDQRDDDDDRSNEEYSEDMRRSVPPYDIRGDDNSWLLDPSTAIAAAETPEDVAKELQLIGDERGYTDQGHDFLPELNELQSDVASAPGRITVFNPDGSSFVIDSDFCGRVKTRPPKS